MRVLQSWRAVWRIRPPGPPRAVSCEGQVAALTYSSGSTSSHSREIGKVEVNRRQCNAYTHLIASNSASEYLLGIRANLPALMRIARAQAFEPSKGGRSAASS